MVEKRIRTWKLLAAASLLAGTWTLTGCESSGGKGAALGAGAGALAGQLIGGDTEATLLGAAIGAGVGYAVGNEKDKKAARESEEAERAASAQSESKRAESKRAESKRAESKRAGEAKASAARTSPLTGTRWKVSSLVAAEPHEYVSKLVDFSADKVVCTTTLSDGSVETLTDSYTIVGDALVVNRPDGVINAEFKLQGNQLIINCNEFRAVLEKL